MTILSEFPKISHHYEKCTGSYSRKKGAILHEMCFILSLSEEKLKYAQIITDHYELEFHPMALESFRFRIEGEEKLVNALRVEQQLSMLAIARSNDLEEKLLLTLNPNANTKIVDEIYTRTENKVVRMFCLCNKFISKDHAKDARERYKSLDCELFLAMNENLRSEVDDLDDSLLKAIKAGGKDAV